MFQCPLGLIPHFYKEDVWKIFIRIGCCVNALSGLYLISTWNPDVSRMVLTTCQCPLGLIPHFYAKNESSGIQRLIERVNALSGLYLISTNNYHICKINVNNSVNALSGLYLISTKQQAQQQQEQIIKCQCPLGLIPHFYTDGPLMDQL